MNTDDLIAIIFGVVVVIGIILLAGYVLYSALSYWDIKAAIKDCDRDFGRNNWVFYHDDDYIGCSHSSTSISSTSTTQTSTTNTCYVNGKEVECK